MDKYRLLRYCFCFLFMWFLLLDTEGVAQNPPCLCTDCRCADSLELVKLYQATNGAGWPIRSVINNDGNNATSPWMLTQPMTTWFGIGLTNGRVAIIELINLQLSGNIPDLNLPNLYFFHIYGNKLSGTVPNFKLPQLKYLYINNNLLDGTIPNFDLPKLEILNLHDNQFKGTIPKFNLPNLWWFKLENNQLSGCIPREIKINCPLITNGYISNNPNLATQNWANYWNNGEGACSVIDTTCGTRDSSALVTIYNTTKGDAWLNTVANNKKWKVPGVPISNWYGVTVNASGCVTCLDLDGVPNCTFSYGNGNNVQGTLPPAINDLKDLQSIFMGNNKLDSLPTTLDLPKLQNLYLFGNQLKGTLPTFNLPNLEYISLGNNQIRDTLPNFNFPKLRLLNLYVNRFYGKISNFNMPLLDYMNLSTNELTGSIPNFNYPNLDTMLLNSNQLSGTIPNLNLPKLTAFYVKNNKFTFDGVLSPIMQSTKTSVNFNQYTPQDSIYKDTTIIGKTGSNISVDLGIDGAIATNNYKWFKNGQYLRDTNKNVLLLRGVKESDSGVYMCQVTNPNAPLLTLYSRKITIVVNVDTNSCRYKDSLALVRLYNATNGQNWNPAYRWDFSKPMTQWKGVGLNAQGCVECLDLDGDATDCGSWSLNPPGVNMSGVFPSAIGGLTNLYRLHLRGNRNLTGSIPDSIRYLTNLAALYLDSTGISGPLPDGFRDLVSLDDFAGYNTPYNSAIPDFFDKIKKLEAFDFSDTKTTGLLPKSLVSSDSLRRLFLARNKMTGAIPNELANRSLHRLDLSDNDFDSLPKLNLVKWNVAYVGNPFVYLQGNRFTFEDIVPNIKSLSTDFTKIYAPQDSFFQEITYTKNTGAPLSIDLKIDSTLTNNSYKWFKNGIPFRTPTNINKLTFNCLQDYDSGVYTCEVTNTDAPLLTLYSRKITLKVNTLTPTTQNRSICQGQTYTLPSGKKVSTTGLYRDTLKSLTGCDSAIIITNLSVGNIIQTSINKTICSGQTYLLPKGRSVSTAGIYRDTLKTSTGCDSVIVTNLSVESKVSNSVTKTICSGQTYTLFNKRLISKSGLYVDSLKTTNGCDSIIILTLNVTPPLSNVVNKSICSKETYILPGGKNVSTAGIYRDTIKTSGGCDSVVITHLSIKPFTVEKSTQKVCSGGTFRLSNGSVATKGGTYRDTLRSATGCDTILEITLIVDTIKVLKDDTLCLGQTYRLPSGKEVTELGTYRDFLKRIGQCDTLFFITLTEGCTNRLKIYNGVYPDGNDNRYFVVEGINNYPKSKLFIYTKTNDLIFRSAIPYDNLWNGTDQNGTPLPADTYYYILDLGEPNLKPEKGYILLVR